jgi:hypothetical protein
MQPGEKTDRESNESERVIKDDFDAKSKTVFQNAFDFFGLLDATGHVVTLTGRLFQKTNTNTKLLTGQRFSETVFWQSSENTARLVDKAVSDASAGRDSSLLLDFRISADEKIPIELRLQLLEAEHGTDQIFVFAIAIPDKDPTTSQEV